MKAHWRSKSGRLTFEVEGDGHKPLFRGLAEVEEVFGAEEACGLCKSVDIGYRVRKIDDNEYFELRCRACGAQFNFGQHKNGRTLFPKRTDDNGEMPNRGWYKWHPKGEQK